MVVLIDFILLLILSVFVALSKALYVGTGPLWNNKLRSYYTARCIKQYLILRHSFLRFFNLKQRGFVRTWFENLEKQYSDPMVSSTVYQIPSTVPVHGSMQRVVQHYVVNSEWAGACIKNFGQRYCFFWGG